ncbi:MAG: dihydroorotate dehydrogenase [Actinobacteria bacterium]|nr:dihydroorotate dehydrogenase [Actinomycetota bacterium]MSW78081.1 dihydroorotate dehydrogenase [Actinomycetota bacterium]MSX56018.1 dihydroorotate dehydrogenase [Actinomycetota bacterium]MSX93157.1 dihydroorotate dehydrogenase [Actinomycetota bacterium]MSZ83362.1 dihydroorotate dehydrogenase [Actinomycetota bacterium]
MTASGTAGHGAELAPYFDLSELGAFVVKSLASFEWAGNPSPRVHPAGVGMVNAVGLQGPGVQHWLAEELPALAATGARVVASIWGRSLEDYRAAAEMLASAPAAVIAVEVNLSCPNLEGRRGIFAHDAALSADVIAATAGCGRPRWAKLSPNTDRVVEVAQAVHAAGAEAVTLVNTLLGMVLDPHTGRPVLGAGGGGYSGRPLHPVAVRTVYDVHAAIPELPIVGAGGVASGWDAVELMLAGASAVQVGTATFADPRAPLRVQAELLTWCSQRGVTPAELTGLAHRGGIPA